eukprot:TRINITY_DN3173_c0_g1_i2.p1 TRINITY_DN3173_c0_g1~~TRINITY_DN3173_c0_g1_i2.p1  ORF type:complete len:393 (-),score=59.84 TRINITY_DN3173_c0_g1_i2:59-1216(-)
MPEQAIIQRESRHNTFWGMRITPEAQHLHRPPAHVALHLSQACLDFTASSGDVSLWVQLGKAPPTLLCTLNIGSCSFQPLELIFSGDTLIRFYTTGHPVNVHLAGYWESVDPFLDETQFAKHGVKEKTNDGIVEPKESGKKKCNWRELIENVSSEDSDDDSDFEECASDALEEDESDNSVIEVDSDDGEPSVTVPSPKAVPIIIEDEASPAPVEEAAVVVKVPEKTQRASSPPASPKATPAQPVTTESAPAIPAVTPTSIEPEERPACPPFVEEMDKDKPVVSHKKDKKRKNGPQRIVPPKAIIVHETPKVASPKPAPATAQTQAAARPESEIQAAKPAAKTAAAAAPIWAKRGAPKRPLTNQPQPSPKIQRTGPHQNPRPTLLS